LITINDMSAVGEAANLSWVEAGSLQIVPPAADLYTPGTPIRQDHSFAAQILSLLWGRDSDCPGNAQVCQSADSPYCCALASLGPTSPST
jgi:hypothetical protein